MSAPSPPQTQLELADSGPHIELARMLFLEYQDSLGVDLCFQGFDLELQTLPGEYATPQGALLLAFVDGEAAGCCAMRPLFSSDYTNACEMKRLYVRRAFRGFGLGRLLAERAMDMARQAGYACMLLDTLDEMEAARTLYEDLGFMEVAPYYHNPLVGAHYLKADL
jgi:putative acetyltransferase